VDRAISDQQSRVTILTGALGDITDVDMGDALSRLNQAQTAVQASAQVFSSLKNTSLLNYITF
jgi:flagellar hook-associated protein 3 FlgL